MYVAEQSGFMRTTDLNGNSGHSVFEPIKLDRWETKFLRGKIAVIADVHRDPLDVARARVEILEFIALLFADFEIEELADAEWRRGVHEAVNRSDRDRVSRD
jgi:hypothetical protein